VLVESFSQEVRSGTGFKAGRFKTWTRRWKGMPVVRSFYRVLLQRFLRRQMRMFRDRIQVLLKPWIAPGSTAEIFTHTECHLREALVAELQPVHREVLEHGLGDYLGWANDPRGPALRCLFADEYARFLRAHSVSAERVRSLFVPERLQDLLKPLWSVDEATRRALATGRPLVLLLLEAVDMYNVPDAFWGRYIRHVIAALPDPDRYVVVLKPHHMQSQRSLDLTLKACDEAGIAYELIHSPGSTGVSAEVLFSVLADRTEHVFCLFSSACFYLSKLYPHPQITYHYSTTFMEQWTSAAPPMYKRHFAALKPLIEEVFAARCQPY
jgi:hypothetical protein